MPENREFKSSTFSMLMDIPKEALKVYNALNHSNYTDETALIMKKLEGGISLSMRNDASFVLYSDLNIYEHQSTYNPNMPLRGLFYYAELIKPDVVSRDLYSRRKIKIPLPHFVVFYNGTENRPAVEVQRLSDLFEKHVDNPELELVVTIYNINPGKNDALLSACSTLKEYTLFVEKVRSNVTEGIALGDAIHKAVDECIREHILEDFLRENRNEVEKSMAIDMTWEVREGLIRKEEREEGRLEGLMEGKSTERIHAIKNLIQKGQTKEFILELAYSEEEYETAKKRFDNTSHIS